MSASTRLHTAVARRVRSAATSATSAVSKSASAAGNRLHLRSRPGKAAALRDTAARSARAGRSTAAAHPRATGSTLGSLVLLLAATMLLVLRHRRGDSDLSVAHGATLDH